MTGRSGESLDTLTNVQTGALSARPTADGTQGWFFTNDNNGVYYDNGSWQLIAEHPSNINAGDLGFNPATQTELNNHAGQSGAHHSKYTDSEARSAIEAGNLNHVEGINGFRIDFDNSSYIEILLNGNRTELVTDRVYYDRNSQWFEGDHGTLAGIGVNDHHARDHSSRHQDGGADELHVENLPATSTDTSQFFQPDGAGGVQVASPGGGSKEPVYGDGSDGSISRSSNGNEDGIIQATTYEIQSGVTMTVNNGYLIVLAQQSITIDGTIDGVGNGASGGSGGAGTGTSGENASPGDVGSTGIFQSAGGNGGAGGDPTPNSGGPGAGGGGAGNNDSGGQGGDGGDAGGVTYSDHTTFTILNANTDIWSDIWNFIDTGAGGGGGGGSASASAGNNGANGGDGGNGGAAIILIAPEINITGTLMVDGGNGDNGNWEGFNSSSGSGGGGGGTGGTVALFADSIPTDNGTYNANGGSGGSGGPAGSNGTNGASGGNGSAGKIVKVSN